MSTPFKRRKYRVDHIAPETPSIHRSTWALTGFLLVAVFFLWTEHRAHLLGILPYLLLLACPLMHMFHHGHGHRHGGAGDHARRPDDVKRGDADAVPTGSAQTGEQP